ncbi:putative ribonuclease H protein [Vitis vinifera]|uniref:Putative ribonuclease H protein n=1 Tax=Vitis vinifera TaxID=29760 RepID=A0A438C3A2_VITVI|nr:putative ribonuclease H protein [Vitis vinifera]
MESPFIEDEIHVALMEMNGDKAPDPDGFTMAFWQSCWEFIKEEILEMFKDFYEHSSFLKSLNNTFLVLIPKKSGAKDLGDFRPISLLGGLYKLLAKVLANKLKKVVGKVVLQKMGFGSKWVGWMWSCLSSAKFSVMVNGVPAGFFPSTKGLRQGDPLSPYLFVMRMEVLDVLIRRAVEGFFLSGCNIRGAASGLRINLAKSEIIPVGEVVEMEELAVELDKDKGGLGLRKLAMLNKALLGKWIWRPKKANGAVGVGVWKEIWKESEWCWDNMIFRVGKGNTIRFWTDVWCSESVLSHCFPHLFVGVGVGWGFSPYIEGHKPSLEEDSVLWRQGRSGQFRVKEAYSLLVRSDVTGFPSRSIWVARVPTKVAFFVWEATWGKVLTLDRLQRRGLQLPNRCFLCGCEEESVNHILIHCTVVRALWDIVLV